MRRQASAQCLNNAGQPVVCTRCAANRHGLAERTGLVKRHPEEPSEAPNLWGHVQPELYFCYACGSSLDEGGRVVVKDEHGQWAKP